MNFLQWLYDAQLHVSGDQNVYWREIVGNAFGFASAIGGMRRRVWAWPVGIVGNVLLFSVFIAATFDQNAQQPLFGQAGRQVFFVITSVYGWWRWRQVKAHRAQSAPAITPRWATAGQRLGYLGVWLAGVLVFQWLFSVIGAGFPVHRWYYWCDAWIFVGSMVATFAMARGWNDFWLCWIAVDAVGVPLLWHSKYYATSVMYVAYAALVVWGFVVWLRASRTEGDPDLVEQARDPQIAGEVS